MKGEEELEWESHIMKEKGEKDDRDEYLQDCRESRECAEEDEGGGWMPEEDEEEDSWEWEQDGYN